MSGTVYNALEVTEGLCSLKSIVGDEFVTCPRGSKKICLRSASFAMIT